LQIGQENRFPFNQLAAFTMRDKHWWFFISSQTKNADTL